MDELPLTFDPCFGRLGREIARFANHTQKLLRASRRYREVLLAAMRWSEGAAPLAETPEDPAVAMRAIDKFARVVREPRPALLGAYFAHHTLRIHAETSRELLRESFDIDPVRRLATTREVYERAEERRRRWVSALLDLCINAAAPDLNRSDYAAFNVGSLTDHEDVDLAIIVANVEAGDALARGFAVVKKTFLTFASKIQLFLTEQMSTPRSAALLEEYEQFLERPTRSVVSIMQLLGAELLCGNPRFARALDARVTSQYYAGEGDPVVHEGFLRAVMAELRHVVEPAPVPGVLAPKREVYVPSKLVTAAVRVIHGVRETQPSRALATLAKRDPAYRETYLALADAFVENEMLRALLFLYVFAGDAFDLDDAAVRNASRRVALLLGLGASARRSAEYRLIGAYADIRARALRNVSTLSFKIGRHLGRVSVFRKLVERTQDLPLFPDNMATRVLGGVESYRGSVFWEEVVNLIGGDREHASRFLDDLSVLSIDVRTSVASRYVRLMSEHPASLVELLIFVCVHERRLHHLSEEGFVGPIARVFWEEMITFLDVDAAAREAFIMGLDAETKAEALFRLANAYPPNLLARLADVIERAEASTRVVRVVRTLRSVMVLVHHRSNAIGRHSARVLARVPEFVQRLGSTRRLNDLASEVITEAAREPRPREQIELIGDSFDVSVLRAALMAVIEGTPSAGDIDFTNAVDRYVRELFKACFRDVRDRSAMFDQYRPASGIAIYATGGCGRSEAFIGDWDYLAVMAHEDRGMEKFFGKVLQRVSGAMTRRGLLPHNRFTAHFNAYIVSVARLRDYVCARKPETFIDEAEILEARFFFGDPLVARAFNDEIRSLVVDTHAEAFIRDILAELENRRSAAPLGLNLKLGNGGLREIHLLWLAIRVFARLPGPLVPEFLPQAAAALPECRADLRFLMVANTELRRARDLYRLAVAYDDTIDVDVLVGIARDLAPLREAGMRDDYGRDLEELLFESAARVDRVARAIAEKIGARS